MYSKECCQNNRDKAGLWKHNGNSEEAENYGRRYYLI